MKLHDSLRRATVDFQPQTPGEVTVYGCGPTIYNFAHIGNFRTFLVYDLLHRTLEWKGYRVRFVVNLTDVDDKTIKGAAAAGKKLEEHTDPFAWAFMTTQR
ncbi:MAG: cysteine--tRNA ligase, partial [Gemmatimonadota bacterium]|nr:cysteine--tRNA ligase [Gemmatimonadota bacterium]